MIKPYLYAGAVILVAASFWFTYNAGKQSVIHQLSSDRVEVLKDGQKVDADVFSADDSGLFCMLYTCNN